MPNQNARRLVGRVSNVTKRTVKNTNLTKAVKSTNLTRIVKSTNTSTRTVKTANITRSTIRPRGNALYFYKIYPEDAIPGKKWCLTYSPILKKLFGEDPEWQEVRNARQAHFIDHSQQSAIKSFFRTKVDITTKIFLAKTLQKKIVPTFLEDEDKDVSNIPNNVFDEDLGLDSDDLLGSANSKAIAPSTSFAPSKAFAHSTSFAHPTSFAHSNEIVASKAIATPTETRPEFYPPTLVCINGKVQPILTENQKLFDKNKPAKWFLKPSAGYGGSGLRVLNRPQEAKKYITQKAQGFPQETLDRNPLKVQRAEYVLQLGIEPYLMQGFKFDIRIWILFKFNNKNQFQSFLYDDAFLRVCSKLYQKDSLNPLINLTNLTYHQDQRSIISKTYTLKSREYYSEVYPKIHQATKIIVENLKDSIAPGPYRGYEIMGFDFILDQDLNPHLLEINRHIGWPITARNKSVVDLIYKMMRDTINFAIKPLINPNLIPESSNWDPLTEFTVE